MARIVCSALKLAFVVVLMLSILVPSLSSMRGSEILASASGQQPGICAPVGQLCFPVGYPCCESLESKFDNSYSPAFKCAERAVVSELKQGCATEGQLCYTYVFPCFEGLECMLMFSFPPTFRCAASTMAVFDG